MVYFRFCHFFIHLSVSVANRRMVTMSTSRHKNKNVNDLKKMNVSTILAVIDVFY